MSDQTNETQFGDPGAPQQPFGGTIQEQVVLSWGKTVEISFNAVKVRFLRSLITASGVVLAITFLMATFTRGAALKGMNEGIPVEVAVQRDGFGSTVELVALAKKAAAGNPELKALPAKLDQMDFEGAEELLNQSMEKGGVVAGGAELKALLSKALESTSRIRELERLKRKLIENGEAVGMDREEQRESEARDYWLIGLALLVSLVGIINAMLMSVTERFREIGTMKCLGALDTFIVKLFLIESSFQGFFGTVLGVLLGLLLSFAKLYYQYGWDVLGFMPGAELGLRVLCALGIGTLLAVIGALYPAIVAARMEPVVAMRVDQ